jgi:hypothetical protein
MYPDSFAPHYVLSFIYQAEGRYEEAYEESFKELTSGGEDIHCRDPKNASKVRWKDAWQKLVAKKRVSTWDLAGLSLALGIRAKHWTCYLGLLTNARHSTTLRYISRMRRLQRTNSATGTSVASAPFRRIERPVPKNRSFTSCCVMEAPRVRSRSKSSSAAIWISCQSNPWCW